MRLFIAINLNEDIKRHLMEAIDRLRSKSKGGNFTREENLHLTLVFLGEIGNDRSGAVKSAMNRIKEVPFPLAVSGFGKFKRNGGDIYWAGVEKNTQLFDLQRRLAVVLEEAGFKIEKREFSPHLTLGREVRLLDSSSDIYGDLNRCRCEMGVGRISLMKSERIGGKLVYSEIYAVTLHDENK